MKRLIGNYIADIDIVINLDVIEEEQKIELMMASYITRIDSLPSEHQTSNAVINELNGLIEYTIKQIKKNFTIIESYKSYKGYSYYIRFQTQTGEIKDIGFRISTHRMSNYQRRNSRWVREQVEIHDFVMNGNTINSVRQLKNDVIIELQNL